MDKKRTYVIVVTGAVLLDEAEAVEYIRDRVAAVIPEGNVTVYGVKPEASIEDFAIEMDLGDLEVLATREH